MSTYRLVGIFFCGGVVTANLSRLIQTNPNFEGSWIAVLVTTLFAVFLAFAEKP